MANSAPAAASLLSQKFAQPDPLDLASSEEPTSLLSSSMVDDPALQSAALSTADPTRDVMAMEPPQKSWTEVLAGSVGSFRREISWVVFSTVLMTVARNACFDQRYVHKLE